MVQTNVSSSDTSSSQRSSPVKKEISKVDASLALSIATWLKKHGKVVHPPLSSASKRQLKECFELMDADGSGAIDAEELHAAFNLLGLSMKRSEVVALIEEVDKDGSGEVDYCEFLQIMTTTLGKNAESNEDNGSKGAQRESSIPFSLMATAYRRKRLMEGLISRDKSVQEQVARMAEALEASSISETSQELPTKHVSESAGHHKAYENRTITTKDNEHLADSLVPRRVKDLELLKTQQGDTPVTEKEAKLEKSRNVIAKDCAVQGLAVGGRFISGSAVPIAYLQYKLSRHSPSTEPENKPLEENCWWRRLFSSEVRKPRGYGQQSQANSTKVPLLQTGLFRGRLNKFLDDGNTKSSAFLPPINSTPKSVQEKKSTLSSHANRKFWELISDGESEESAEISGFTPFKADHDIQQNRLRRKTLLLHSMILSQI